MSNRSDRRSLLIIASVFLFVTAGTYIISLLARGYQINFQNGPEIRATGLLSVTSRPKSASVYINDRLMTATDDTINLLPGNYSIKIVKDGYLPWQKNIQIKKEVVYQTDAQLFRSVPDLSPLSLSGAINPTISPDFTKIVYAVASASAEKDNGLYLVELADNPLNLTRNSPRQIAPNFPGINWFDATFTFSPNSKSLLATFKNKNTNYLIDINSPVTLKSLTDATIRLPLIQNEWQFQNKEIIASRVAKLPPALTSLIATDSAKNVAYSTDENKVLYLAAANGALPQDLISPPPAQSTQIQSRDIRQGYYYVYDLKDDTNFLIAAADQVSDLAWIPGSNSLVFAEGKTIQAIEYDGTNKQTIYAGNAEKPLVYSWADGSRIITLISPFTGAPANLYTISLR